MTDDKKPGDSAGVEGPEAAEGAVGGVEGAEKSSGGGNRRREYRVEFGEEGPWECLLTLEGGGEVVAPVRDLSAHGACLRVPDSGSEGIEVGVSLALRLVYLPDGRSLETEARVCSRAEQADEIWIGVEFMAPELLHGAVDKDLWKHFNRRWARRLEADLRSPSAVEIRSADARCSGRLEDLASRGLAARFLGSSASALVELGTCSLYFEVPPHPKGIAVTARVAHRTPDGARVVWGFEFQFSDPEAEAAAHGAIQRWMQERRRNRSADS